MRAPGRNRIELAKEPLGQATSDAHVGGRLARQVFVVLRGDRAIARAQHLGRAALGFLDRFLVGAACGGSGIADLHQAGQRGSYHRDRIRGDIALGVSRHVPICRGADLAAGGRDRAVAIRRCGRIVIAEADLADHRMQPKELARARREVADEQPILPRAEPATDQRLADLHPQDD